MGITQDGSRLPCDLVAFCSVSTRIIRLVDELTRDEHRVTPSTLLHHTATSHYAHLVLRCYTPPFCCATLHLLALHTVAQRHHLAAFGTVFLDLFVPK